MKIGTFDTEADGFLEQARKVWCGVVKEHSTGNIYSFDPNNICDFLHLLDTFDCLIGHNCVYYDFPLLKKLYGWEYKGQVVDTLLMSRSQNPSRPVPAGYYGKNPNSVEAWGYRLGKKKIQHTDWTRYSPEMLERCIQDVEIQYQIYYALLKEDSAGNWEKAHKLNVQLFKYLQKQEEYGWLIDRKHLEKAIATLERWIGCIDRAIVPSLPFIVAKLETKTEEGYRYVSKPFRKDGTYSVQVERYMGADAPCVAGPFSRVGIRRINLDSIQETKEFLLSQGWEPDKWNEKDGQRTSANLSKDDAFRGITSSLGTLIAKRIQCRQRKSVLEGWGNSIRNDGRLSPKVAGIATTGRLRHSNIVNIPSPHSKAFFAKQMRQCFIAKPGWKLVGVDSKGNQMRQLAARMPEDKEFRDAVLFGQANEATDLHSLNQKRTGAKSRSLAKNFFYGCILFGAGDTKTAKLLSTTVEKAREIKEKYFEEMPALRKVIDNLAKEWKVTAKKRYNPKWNRIELYNGTITGLDGRRIVVPYEKDLLCYALQSDEAIHMAVAYVMLHKCAEKNRWKAGIDWASLIWMHDEIQMEARPEIAKELGELGCKAIKWSGEFLKIDCPHDGSYLIGDNWYETH